MTVILESRKIHLNEQLKNVNDVHKMSEFHFLRCLYEKEEIKNNFLYSFQFIKYVETKQFYEQQFLKPKRQKINNLLNEHFKLSKIPLKEKFKDVIKINLNYSNFNNYLSYCERREQ